MANSPPGGEGTQGAFVASPGLIQVDGINPHPRPEGTHLLLAPGVRSELGRSLQSTLPQSLPKEGWCALAPGVRGEPGRAAQAPWGRPESVGMGETWRLSGGSNPHPNPLLLAPGVRGELGRAAQAPRGMPERGRGNLVIGLRLPGKDDSVDLACEGDYVDVAGGVFAEG